MMKKILTLTFVMLVVAPITSTMAGTCYVTKNTDYAKGSCDDADSKCSKSTFRYYIEAILNEGAANCTPPDGSDFDSGSSESDSDADFFDQSIAFATITSGVYPDVNGDGKYSPRIDKFVSKITLKGSITYTGNDKLIIGNTSDDITSTEHITYSDSYLGAVQSAGDYGNVEFDATDLEAGVHPFECSGRSSGEIYLRNLTIRLTGGLTKSDFWSGCVKNGGDVTLIGLDDDASECTPSTEICNGVDDDCDGSIDEDLTEYLYYQDADGDGYGDTKIRELACAQPEGYSLLSDDCDDSNDKVKPGNTEVCSDGLDNDCDAATLDTGGSCAAVPEVCDDAALADEDGDGVANCSDADCSSHASCVKATEICDNDVDDDGDGSADCSDADCSTSTSCIENCTSSADDDGDGKVNCDDSDCSTSDACKASTTDVDGDGSVSTEDCNDLDAKIYPGAAELCGSCADDSDATTCVADGVDQNCDGEIDEGCSGSPNVDDDGDGLSENAGDCDDTDSAINPDAVELCDDGIDNDCDGSEVDTLSDEFLNGSLTCDISTGVGGQAIGGCACNIHQSAPSTSTYASLLMGMIYLSVLLMLRKECHK